MPAVNLLRPTVTAAQIRSEGATAGHVLAADGSGGVEWVAPGGGSAPQDNLDGAIDGVPYSTDDETEGWSVGSLWYYYNSGYPVLYVCRDATEGAAVWLPLSTTSHTHVVADITDISSNYAPYSHYHSASHITDAGNIITRNDSEFAQASHYHDASEITSGQLSPARGGTGVDSSSGVTAGSLLVGNSGGGWQVGYVVQGSGITITNGDGTITFDVP